MTGLKPPPTLRQQYRDYLRQRGRDELYYLRQAGVKRGELRPLEKELGSPSPHRAFPKIAALAEQRMPELMANRDRWPDSYKVPGVSIIEDIPLMMRQSMRAFASEFMDLRNYQARRPSQLQKILAKLDCP